MAWFSKADETDLWYFISILESSLDFVALQLRWDLKISSSPGCSSIVIRTTQQDLGIFLHHSSAISCHQLKDIWALINTTKLLWWCVCKLYPQSVHSKFIYLQWMLFFLFFFLSKRQIKISPFFALSTNSSKHSMGPPAFMYRYS